MSIHVKIVLFLLIHIVPQLEIQCRRHLIMMSINSVQNGVVIIKPIIIKIYILKIHIKVCYKIRVRYYFYDLHVSCPFWSWSVNLYRCFVYSCVKIFCYRFFAHWRAKIDFQVKQRCELIIGFKLHLQQTVFIYLMRLVAGWVRNVFTVSTILEIY